MPLNAADPTFKQHWQNPQIYKKKEQSNFIKTEIRYIIPMFYMGIM
ncbi:hypothetical protein BC749_102715 [Flavobacterium araucananum]|nr:hypothetical protein BC749_102715 [Flavobacterium araucananum]